MRDNAWIELTSYKNGQKVPVYIPDIVTITEGFEVFQGVTCQFTDLEIDTGIADVSSNIRVVESPREIGKIMVASLMKKEKEVEVNA